MDQGISRSAGVAAMLGVLGASGVAAAGVRTEGMYLLADASVAGRGGIDFRTLSASGWESSRGTGAVDQTQSGPGSSFVGYRLELSSTDQTAGRIRFDGAVTGEDYKNVSIITSFGNLWWQFETSEPTTMELRGLFQWEGDKLFRSEMDISLRSHTHDGFMLMSSDQRNEINTTFVLPAGRWSFQVSSTLVGVAFDDAPTFAARSSLDLDFRIVPAPATFAAFVGLGLMASRRRR